MRQMVHDAVADARGVVAELVRDARETNTLTDDEVLQQYEGLRGDPTRVVAFTQQRLGAPAVDGVVLEEALRYEREMEKLRARAQQRGGV